ncbi:YfdX protein [Nitrosomonas sp. Nm51]|uniref:YfdX family protein n=1 Tax=Nitrosomonas sp. Nm51 TaxID=133720 RepID=UPI0008B32CA4|nr:YfdX family protein [Nitrosomonas sp. Nm51]SER79976.1 YfdX protein [Nitrosomonas sp. Nm51]
MKKISTLSFLPYILLVALISLPLYAEENKPANRTENPAESSVSKPTENTNVEKKVTQEREKIIKEAVAAIQESKKALTALENNKKKAAIDALEESLGKLEVVLARDPDLSLATIDTRIAIHDLYTSLEGIKLAKKEAEDYLEDNKVQKARELLKDLASEVIIRTTSIPLATYPDALKAVVSLIDEDKTKEAKTALHAALSSLIVTDYVIPLPFVRAEENLYIAESLAEKKDRTEKENTSLAILLEDTRTQLKMAEALGYGNKVVYEKLHEQIDSIIAKTEGNKYGKGYFDEIYKFLSELVRPLTKDE